MIRRAFWFVAGAATGISGFVWTKKQVTVIRGAITPGSIVHRTFDGTAAVVRRVREAIAVGREVMRQGSSTATPRTVVRSPRRHIASRPRNTHG